jgi:Spy/CpxP family protein refolding chaperone
MTRTKTTWLVAGILAAGVTLATTAVRSDAYRGGHSVDRLQQHLGLSDDQVKALHEARERRWEARRQLWKSMGAARRSLQELILTGAHPAAIQAKTAEVQQLLAQATQMRVQALQDMTQVLTPEQRQKMLQLYQGHRRGPVRS